MPDELTDKERNRLKEIMARVNRVIAHIAETEIENIEVFGCCLKCGLKWLDNGASRCPLCRGDVEIRFESLDE